MADVAELVLTFVVNEQRFGVDVLRVQEIRAWTEPTPLPHVPSWVRGVVNLRGHLVAVVDLRERLGFGALVLTPQTAMVVLRALTPKGEAQVLGVLVDATDAVSTLAPARSDSLPSGLTRAFALEGDSLISLLDVDILFGSLGALPTRC